MADVIETLEVIRRLLIFGDVFLVFILATLLGRYL